MNKVMMIYSERGAIKKVEELDANFGKLNDIKNIIKNFVDVWNPQESDFVVLADSLKISLLLPLSSNQLRAYSNFNIRREGNVATIEVPVYVVSYGGREVKNEYFEEKVIVIAPYIDDKVKNEIMKLSEELTKHEEENIQR